MESQETQRLNILMLYDEKSTFTNTVKEYLESFCLFSKHQIYYAQATNNKKCQFDLKWFDVVVIHYSVRLSLEWHLSPFYAESIQKFDGLKILYIQDEYDTTETARNWIEKLGIDTVFSCVPQNYLDKVYPSSRFNNVEFISILTGFVPIHLEKITTFKPLSERKITIGYRGRELPYWYGHLGREKLLIGQRMRYYCESKGIVCDIEWEDKKRIYGTKWYEFIENCRATLGSESGSNVFDDYGNIKKNIENYLKENPLLKYEDAHEKYIADYEGKIIMNQISPKIFEAIALKTGLVLFEGNYSGIIQPDIHYIPLKKDFSNVDEVIDKVLDDRYLNELINTAHRDIIQSGKYSYRRFIQEFDKYINQKISQSRGFSPLFIYENSYHVKEMLDMHNKMLDMENSLLNMKNIIEGMESSKFWKLRTKWLNLKKFLGLGNDVG